MPHGNVLNKIGYLLTGGLPRQLQRAVPSEQCKNTHDIMCMNIEGHCIQLPQTVSRVVACSILSHKVKIMKANASIVSHSLTVLLQKFFYTSLAQVPSRQLQGTQEVLLAFSKSNHISWHPSTL